MLLVVLLLAVLVGVLVFIWLHGQDLSAFDRGYPRPVAGTEPSAAMGDVIASVEAFARATDGLAPGKARIHRLRAALEGISQGKVFAARFTPSAADEPKGEWVQTDASDANRRLLYVHGGGFVAGSPKSHRMITSALCELTGMTVFALDYRLLPEHGRLASLEDTVGALCWLRNHGPEGNAEAGFLGLVGDSAGGNLILAAAQQIRDRGLANADALVALSPSTDVTLRSPSMRFNRHSDALLGKSVGRLSQFPAPLRHLIFLFVGRRSPAAPVFSPLRGKLTNLPPLLLQVSLTEMLLDDAARYYHRAREQGAEVTLETYDNMVHVWHMFYPELPEARIALERIRDFLSTTEHRAALAATGASPTEGREPSTGEVAP